MDDFLPPDLVALPTAPYDVRPASMPLDIEECRTAIWMSEGNISKAAERLKVPSARLRAFVKSSPRLTDEVKEAMEQIKDLAQGVAVAALKDANDPGRQDSMARFVLGSLGRDRGFGSNTGKSSINVNAAAGSHMTIVWDDGTSLVGDNALEQPDDDGLVIDGAVNG